MAAYDFSTLNSADLEELACDLLNAQEFSKGSGISFRTFKDGKDRGVDLLSSSSKSFEVVGQVKHYFRSGFHALLRDLRQEKIKVDKIAPARYIIVTSLDLSVNDAETIQELFGDYLRKDDIYGKKDLNRLLDAYPNVLENHFKLWFASTNVLKRILQHYLTSRASQFQEEELKLKLRIYVPTPILKCAQQALKNSNFLIITGEPGVGKTTTAQMLVNKYLIENFELIYIYDDLKEVERLWDEDKKQLIYFDDFLGHNSTEIAKAKSAEGVLVRILHKVQNATNKKMILTTRTFILAAVVADSERLRRLGIRQSENIMELHEYSQQDRQRLLLNHADELDPSDPHKMVLDDPVLQSFIVNHPNFSPRSVEYVTSKDIISRINAADYENFVRMNFKKPDEIWLHAYEQQITELERIMINTMVSFGFSVNIKELETAFNARLDYEAAYKNLRVPINVFKTTFGKLEGGFIVPEYSDSVDDFKFINPSLVDFLVNLLRGSSDEVERISESAFFLRQLTARLYTLDYKSSWVPSLSKGLEQKLIEEFEYYLKELTRDQDSMRLAILLSYYSRHNRAEALICQLLVGIDNWAFLEQEYELCLQTRTFLFNINKCQIVSCIQSLDFSFFATLLLNETNIDLALELLRLFSMRYNLKLPKMIQSNSSFELSEFFTSLINQKILEDIDELLDTEYAQDFVDEKELKTYLVEKELEEFGISTNANFNVFRDHDWYEIGTYNHAKELAKRDDS